MDLAVMTNVSRSPVGGDLIKCVSCEGEVLGGER